MAPVMTIDRSMLRSLTLAALALVALVLLVGPRAAVYLAAGWSARAYARPVKREEV